MRPSACRVLPRAAVAAAFAVAWTPAAAAAQAGATFTYRVQSTAAARSPQGAPAGGSPNMLATVRMAGGNARIDFREGGLPTTGNGGYVLIRGAERQFVMVNPRERQAVVTTAAGLGAGMGALANNRLVRLTIRDPRLDVEELGAGERVLGMATRRVRVRQSFTTEVRVLGRTQRSADTTTSEHWIAPRPAGVDVAALEGWSRAFTGSLAALSPALEAQMADYQRRLGDGLVVRTVAVARRDDGRGRSTTDTTRSEITEFTRGRIDPSVFAVPAGYQTVDAGQAMSAAADSMRRTDSAAADPRRSAGESAREAIGGLLRRRRP